MSILAVQISVLFLAACFAFASITLSSRLAAVEKKLKALTGEDT